MIYTDHSPHFSREELQCKVTGLCEMSQDFLDKLEAIRILYGKPLHPTSAYRHPSHPVEKRKPSPGYHSQGRAIDLAVYGEDAIKILQLALEHGMRGIGLYQVGSFDERYVHLDDRDNCPMAIWTY